MILRLKRLQERLAADFLPRDRSLEYAAHLRHALDVGYSVIALRDLERRVRDGFLGARGELLLALRHDVDIINVSGNAMFFSIERAAGVSSTYYFRLSTAGPHGQLIERLRDAGHEVGYHFEEGAMIAKRYRLRHRDEVLARRDQVQERFIRNCDLFRRRWNADLWSVSSHGDWINRRLGFANHELVDGEVLGAAGVGFEAYQSHLMDAADIYVSDVASSPERWARGVGLDHALSDRRSPIYLLTHERRWHTAPLANMHQNAVRTFETLRYHISLVP